LFANEEETWLVPLDCARTGTGATEEHHEELEIRVSEKRFQKGSKILKKLKIKKNKENH